MAHYLISYDISNDRLRNHAAKVLTRHGCKRLQKSVFLAPDFEPRELRRLREDLTRMLHTDADSSDSLLCVPITKNYLQDVLWHGDQAFFDKQMKSVLFELL